MSDAGKKSDSLTLSAEPQSDVPVELMERVGWTFWEKIKLKDGRTVAAEGVTYDPSDDGRKNVMCLTHETLYDRAVADGIRALVRLGPCNFSISWDDLDTYSHSGPNPIMRRD